MEPPLTVRVRFDVVTEGFSRELCRSDLIFPLPQNQINHNCFVTHVTSVIFFVLWKMFDKVSKGKNEAMGSGWY